MSGETSETESIPEQPVETPVSSVLITPKRILWSMVTGAIGLVLMAPLLVGVPLALGVFEAEPIAEFADIASFFGLQAEFVGPLFGLDPNLLVGVALFALGGVLFLPVQFLVVGAFLPPESPRFVRGMTFMSLWWFGFIAAFWPGGGLVTIGVFLVVSLLSHWVYGGTMGYLVQRFGGIPQHEV